MQIAGIFLAINFIAPQLFFAYTQFFGAYAKQSTAIGKGRHTESMLTNNFMDGYENYKYVIIEGRGIDEKQASLNASTKALQQVAGIFIDIRETLQVNSAESNGIIEENNERFGVTQSFYSDGSIRSFQKLATRRKDGITIVIAKVSVWQELQKKPNVHPLLASNLSSEFKKNNSGLKVKARGIGRTYQLALINAIEEAIASVSLSFTTVENLNTYEKVKEVITNYVSSFDFESYFRSKSNSSKAVQGVVQSMEIINESMVDDLYHIDINATVRANILDAYLSNVN